MKFYSWTNFMGFFVICVRCQEISLPFNEEEEVLNHTVDCFAHLGQKETIDNPVGVPVGFERTVLIACWGDSHHTEGDERFNCWLTNSRAPWSGPPARWQDMGCESKSRALDYLRHRFWSVGEIRYTSTALGEKTWIVSHFFRLCFQTNRSVISRVCHSISLA